MVALATLTLSLAARAEDPAPGPLPPLPAPTATVVGPPPAPAPQTQVGPEATAASGPHVADGPRVIEDFDADTEGIPAGYHTEKRPRRRLIIAGALTFGISYFLSVLAPVVEAGLGAMLGNREPVSTLPLLIPVAGPFVQMLSADSSTKMVLAVDGIAQVGGMALLLVAVAGPKIVLVRDAELRVIPMRIGRDGFALGVGRAF